MRSAAPPASVNAERSTRYDWPATSTLVVSSSSTVSPIHVPVSSKSPSDELCSVAVVREVSIASLNATTMRLVAKGTFVAFSSGVVAST